MISYKGKLGLVVAIPVLAQMIGMIDIPGLTAQVAGLVQLVANFSLTPPTIAAGFQFVANLTAQLQVAVEPPVLQISAELTAKLALFKLRLELILKIVDLVTGGSVRVYEYDGPAGSFGPELGATLGGADVDGGIAPAQQTFAVILLAEGGSSGEVALKTLRGGA